MQAKDGPRDFLASLDKFYKLIDPSFITLF